MRQFSRWGLPLLLVGVGSVGCASILGIEDANCDSRIAGCDGSTETSADDVATDTDDTGASGTETEETDVTQTDSDTDAPDASAVETDATDVATTDVTDVETETDVSDAVTDVATDVGTDDLPDGGVETDTADPPDAAEEPPEPEAGPAQDPDAAVLKRRLCDEYCTVTQANCTADNAQHGNDQSCLDICMNLMLSAAEQPDTTSGDTIECRLEFAEDAETAEPEFNCPAAGLSGADLCGEPCPVFCGMMERVCPAEFATTFTNCTEECLDLPRETGPLTLAMTSGNTLECRFNHLRLATETELPEVHCPHVAGAAPCSD